LEKEPITISQKKNRRVGEIVREERGISFVNQFSFCSEKAKGKGHGLAMASGFWQRHALKIAEGYLNELKGTDGWKAREDTSRGVVTPKRNVSAVGEIRQKRAWEEGRRTGRKWVCFRRTWASTSNLSERDEESKRGKHITGFNRPKETHAISPQGRCLLRSAARGKRNAQRRTRAARL